MRAWHSMAVLWLTTTLVAAVAADFKVFRANRCNTNAEVSQSRSVGQDGERSP